MIEPSKIVIKAAKVSSIAIVESETDIRPTLPEPMDPVGFPHTRNRKDGTLKPKNTIEAWNASFTRFRTTAPLRCPVAKATAQAAARKASTNASMTRPSATKSARRNGSRCTAPPMS